MKENVFKDYFITEDGVLYSKTSGTWKKGKGWYIEPIFSILLEVNGIKLIG